MTDIGDSTSSPGHPSWPTPADTFVVFRSPLGVEPTPENGEFLWSAGDPALVREIVQGTVLPSDRIISLAPATDGGAEQMWMVHRLGDTTTGTVLVVDDTPTVVDFYIDALVSFGHTAVGASNAAEALTALQLSAFDVVLLDVRLPDANGFELCREIIATPLGRHSRVLLMSADPEQADNDRVLAAGADGFIVNPAGAEAIQHSVEQALRRRLSPGPEHQVEASSAAQRIRLRFFGEPAISSDDGITWTPIPKGRSANMLATLSAACPVSVTPERLARFVWPGASEISPNAVYTAISRLRSFLGAVGASNLVSSNANGYGLDIDPNQIDLVAYELAATEVRRQAGQADPDEVRRVLRLWVQPPFAGSSNSMLERWSNRLTQTHSRLLEILALNEVLGGDVALAEQTCIELLAHEPWREAIWSLRVVALYRSGRSNDALVTFGEACERLRSELGLEPGPALAGLELLILTHDPILLRDDWLRSLVEGRTAADGDPPGGAGSIGD